VQAKPDELPTKSLQALKRRAHQLLESQRNLQQQIQALAAERQSLQSERDELNTQCLELSASLDALQAERKTLLEQQEALDSARNGLLTALRHVFPYASYRDQRPDLTSFNENDLVNHFVNRGLHEGVNLEANAEQGELKQLRASLEEASAKAELFKEKTRHTAAQLDVLKDIFIRIAVQP
jgi:chromosome segregation ATPase